MLILIILLILFFGGLYMCRRFAFGLIISLLSGMYIILHLLLWGIATYSYNIFYVQREAFVETLDSARKNSNPIELAAITHDILKWNQELAERKYDRSTFLLRDYIDKRTELLKPIK